MITIYGATLCLGEEVFFTLVVEVLVFVDSMRITDLKKTTVRLSVIATALFDDSYLFINLFFIFFFSSTLKCLVSGRFSRCSELKRLGHPNKSFLSVF